MKAWSLFGACLVACSTQSNTSDSGKDAGADVIADASADVIEDVKADAPQEAGNDAGCNEVTNVGTVIQQLNVASAPVTGDGGTIATGTYVCTAAVVYTGADGGSGPTGTTIQETVLFHDGRTYERVASIVSGAGADGSPIRQNGSYTLAGSTISITQTCPPGAQPFTSYDSDGTKLHIYAPAAGPGNPGVMFEYTKQ